MGGMGMLYESTSTVICCISGGLGMGGMDPLMGLMGGGMNGMGLGGMGMGGIPPPGMGGMGGMGSPYGMSGIVSLLYLGINCL